MRRRAAPPLVLGPVPPPTDGRALATEALVGRLREHGVDASVVDTQLPASRLRVLRKTVRCVRAAAQVVASPRPLVVVASGGLGLLPELIALAVARLGRSPRFVVHHSSLYVGRRSALMALFCRAGGAATRHVFLCDPMRREFSQTYGLDAARQVVLDNLALLDAAAWHGDADSDHVTVLHLSNLSPEKGSAVFIDLALKLMALAAVRFEIAGPMPEEIHALMPCAIEKGARLRYLGALAGAEKSAAFERADAFVFPTTYQHEAQPLVLYEAAQRGAVPMAWSVGWIPDQMQRLGCSRFVAPPGDVEAFALWLRELAGLTAAERRRQRHEIMASYEAERSRALDGLRQFVDQVNISVAQEDH